MADDVKEKPGKKHKHEAPIKQGDKFICPKCGAEIPMDQDCPSCQAHIDWKKI